MRQGYTRTQNYTGAVATTPPTQSTGSRLMGKVKGMDAWKIVFTVILAGALSWLIWATVDLKDLRTDGVEGEAGAVGATGATGATGNAFLEGVISVNATTGEIVFNQTVTNTKAYLKSDKMTLTSPGYTAVFEAREDGPNTTQQSAGIEARQQHVHVTTTNSTKKVVVGNSASGSYVVVNPEDTTINKRLLIHGQVDTFGNVFVHSNGTDGGMLELKSGNNHPVLFRAWNYNDGGAGKQSCIQLGNKLNQNSVANPDNSWFMCLVPDQTYHFNPTLRIGFSHEQWREAPITSQSNSTWSTAVEFIDKGVVKIYNVTSESGLHLPNYRGAPIKNLNTFSTHEVIHTVVGAWASNGQVLLRSTRIQCLVTVSWDHLSGTSDKNADLHTFSQAIGDHFKPLQDSYTTTLVNNNGVRELGLAIVYTNGEVAWHRSPTNSSFDNSGTSVVYPGSLSYHVC